MPHIGIILGDSGQGAGDGREIAYSFQSFLICMKDSVRNIGTAAGSDKLRSPVTRCLSGAQRSTSPVLMRVWMFEFFVYDRCNREV